MGAPAPVFFEMTVSTPIHDKERALTREVAQRVEQELPNVEVLALELSGPDRFTVYIDHPNGVDHALCERVTAVLRSYLDRYTVDVSSPGLERPLRKAAHFRQVIGRKVAVRTGHELQGRKRFRGTVVAADAGALALDVGDGERMNIPYDEIVRGNLIEV
jgi:ribosome maturation factor RimP